MSLKNKVLAAAATLTVVGGVGAASALTAGSAAAATPSCGSSCVNIYSKQFGTHAHPNYVIDVLRQFRVCLFHSSAPFRLFRCV